jgi:hypothetical protein
MGRVRRRIEVVLDGGRGGEDTSMWNKEFIVASK